MGSVKIVQILTNTPGGSSSGAASSLGKFVTIYVQEAGARSVRHVDLETLRQCKGQEAVVPQR